MYVSHKVNENFYSALTNELGYELYPVIKVSAEVEKLNEWVSTAYAVCYVLDRLLPGFDRYKMINLIAPWRPYPEWKRGPKKYQFILPDGTLIQWFHDSQQWEIIKQGKEKVS